MTLIPVGVNRPRLRWLADGGGGAGASRHVFCCDSDRRDYCDLPLYHAGQRISFVELEALLIIVLVLAAFGLIYYLG